MRKKAHVLAALSLATALVVLAAASPAFAGRTRLLYPFVTSMAGFDTGISISNTSADPFGTPPESGTCTLYFYGASAPPPYTTPNLAAGQTYTNLASIIAPGFQGYMIALCRFRYAHGWGMVSDIGTRTIMSSYIPLVINIPRTTGVESLGE